MLIPKRGSFILYKKEDGLTFKVQIGHINHIVLARKQGLERKRYKYDLMLRGFWVITGNNLDIIFYGYNETQWDLWQSYGYDIVGQIKKSLSKEYDMGGFKMRCFCRAFNRSYNVRKYEIECPKKSSRKNLKWEKG